MKRKKKHTTWIKTTRNCFNALIEAAVAKLSTACVKCKTY